jgi:hypothetical protein
MGPFRLISMSPGSLEWQPFDSSEQTKFATFIEMVAVTKVKGKHLNYPSQHSTLKFHLACVSREGGPGFLMLT